MEPPLNDMPTDQAPAVCACEEWMRKACGGDYLKSNEKQYCLLHFPGEKDRKGFDAIVKERIDGQSYDFHGVVFPGEADFSNQNFALPVSFASARFKGEVSFKKAEFGAEADFNKAQFDSGADFCDARFQREAKFSDAWFLGAVKFAGADFEGRADFQTAKFRNDAQPVDFERAKFIGGASFNNRAEFSGRAVFVDTQFDKEADFQSAQFFGEADFLRAEFKGEQNSANFSAALFSENATFSKTRFIGEADFGKDQFDKDADFRDAEFGRGAIFSGRRFVGRADFQRSQFNGAADFSDQQFDQDANFRDAVFSGETDFNKRRFIGKVDFQKVQFTRIVKFVNVFFNREAGFEETTFKDYVRFSGEKSSHVFAPGAWLNLQFAHFEKPERVSFHTLNLRPHWFINTDPRKFDFVKVDWDHNTRPTDQNGDHGGAADSKTNRPLSWFEKRQRLDYEWEAVTGMPGDDKQRHKLLSIAYRQLAINAEENHRYGEASQFRYESMEIRRWEHCYNNKRRTLYRQIILTAFRNYLALRYKSWRKRLGFGLVRDLIGQFLQEIRNWKLKSAWSLDWLYWMVSKYGESVSRCFIVFLVLLATFAASFTAVEFERTNNARSSLDWREALVYSLSVSLLQRPEPKPATGAGKTLVLLETALVPAQAALLALAIRRRFMR
jgi:Pentapeptide repeats (9 copies)